jgi:DNA-binding PadR family transcriptional regulator
MSREELTPFSYTVLGLVGRDGAGPHDIVRMMRQGRVYWTASASHYYAEPKRLAKLGYLAFRKEPGKTRERTHYVLTDKGRVALEEWLRRPTPFPRIQNEAAVRMMAADFADDEELVASLAALRDEANELERWLDQAEAVAATLPHRERYLRLLHGFGRRMVDAHRDWVDEVERELGAGREDAEAGAVP